MINEIDKKIDKIDITEPCPAEEPFRQYYFIKKARGLRKPVPLFFYKTITSLVKRNISL